jgi:hypothetical protein
MDGDYVALGSIEHDVGKRPQDCPAVLLVDDRKKRGALLDGDEALIEVRQKSIAQSRALLLVPSKRLTNIIAS